VRYIRGLLMGGGNVETENSPRIHRNMCYPSGGCKLRGDGVERSIFVGGVTGLKGSGSFYGVRLQLKVPVTFNRRAWSVRCFCQSRKCDSADIEPSLHPAGVQLGAGWLFRAPLLQRWGLRPPDGARLRLAVTPPILKFMRENTFPGPFGVRIRAPEGVVTI